MAEWKLMKGGSGGCEVEKGEGGGPIVPKVSQILGVSAVL